MCLVSLGRTAKVGRWTRYIANLEEVIGMLLEDGEPPLDAQYVGTQTVTVP